MAAVAVASAVVLSGRWTLMAQDRPGRAAVTPLAKSAGSVQDAMLKAMDLPFGEQTSLEDVRKFLAKALNAQVVFDRGAMDRLELVATDTVQLDLKGVRLKVGLKLLLDQVGMDFRVVAEDNLLILTDPADSGDPMARTLQEIKAIHREMHDIQDAFDDLRDLVEEDHGVEPEPEKDRRSLVKLTRRSARHRKPSGVRG